MSYPMSLVPFTLGLYVLPPLFLLIFYSMKNRRLVWLTIPASFCAYLFCCGASLADMEFLGMTLVGLIPYMAVLIAVTALAAFLKSKQKKQPNLRVPAIIAAALCAAVLCLAAHSLLLDTADGYRRAFDRPAFTRLTEILLEDIAKAQTEVNGKYSDFQGDMTFFADLEYAGSDLSEPGFNGSEEIRAVRFTLQNGDEISFFLYGGDKFQVFFIEDHDWQIFYVRSPQLLAGMG